MFNRVLLLCIIFILPGMIYGASIDSLKSQVKTLTSDSERILVFNKISEYYRTKNLDSAQRYSQLEVELAKSSGSNLLKGRAYLSLGLTHLYKSNYSKALQYFFEGLAHHKKSGNKKGMASAFTNIGVVYDYQQNYESAIEYQNKALEVAKQIGDSLMIGKVYANLGIVYKLQGHFDKALDYYSRSLSVLRSINKARVNVANTLNNMANIYDERGDIEKALEYHKKALHIRKEIGDQRGVGVSLLNIGGIYLKLDNIDKAKTYLNKSLDMAKELDYRYLEKAVYNGFFTLYEQTGDYKKALEYNIKKEVLEDTIFTERKSEQIAEMEARYKSEKRKRKIEVLKKEKKLDKARLQQNRILLLSAGGGLALVLIFAGFLYNRFQVTRKQKRIIEGQKDIVEEKNKQITDSITYAQRIQQAVLVPEKAIKQSLPKSFALLKPQSIVSGDFYYFAEVRNHIVISAIDCTGHGVPGAFMSLIGNDLLNQIVHDQSITSPAEVLNELDDQLEQALRQESDLKQELEMTDEDFVRDGMDLAFCVLHPAENVKKGKGKITLQYAGANNPLYIVSGSTLKVKGSKIKTFQPDNLQLFELPPDKQPIGKQAEKKPFTDKTVQLNKGDTFYIFSDGYPDQFGGPKGKKFMYKRFRELLLDIQDKPMDEQKKILNQTIEDWMAENNEEQIDDICVMGVRIA